MTLVEMLAAITVLMMLTAILAEVFLQASKAAAKGKSLAEIYQVDRALRGLMVKDFAGATTDFFESRENGLVVNAVDAKAFILDMPPGPYSDKQYGVGLSDARMRRMLAGGSDYLVFTSGTASGSDKAVCKVYYALRETGQFVRVTHADTTFTDMDYAYDAAEQNVNIESPEAMDSYEETRVIAENVGRVKFEFLDMGNGAIGSNAQAYAKGVWVDDWEWYTRPHLPAAVKVELQLVDHLWNLQDGDQLTNKDFNPETTDSQLRASEMFDPEDGEAFTFVVYVPLGTKAAGG